MNRNTIKFGHMIHLVNIIIYRGRQTTAVPLSSNLN